MKKYVIYILIFWLAGVGAAGAYELGDVDIHGFIAQGYLWSNSNDYVAETSKGTFEFNEMGINFSSELTDSLRVGIQLFAYDFGDNGNDEVTLDWAYGDYRFHNMLGLRAGKFKIAKGFYNEVRDVDAVRTSILLPRSIYALNMRDVFNTMKGLGLYGELPAGFSYQGGVGVIDVQVDSAILDTLTRQAEIGAKGVVFDTFYANLTGSGAPPPLAAATARAYAAGINSPEAQSVNAGNAYNIALKWDTPLEGLRLGYSLLRSSVKMSMTLANDDPSSPPVPPTGGSFPGDTLNISYDEVNNTVISAEYTWRDLVLTAEGGAYRIEASFDEGSTVAGQSVAGGTSVRTMPGWYTGVSYRFVDWFELGGYYSEFHEDVDDRKGESYKKLGLPDHLAWEKDACVSLRFDLNDYWIFKTEAHHIDGTYQMKESVFAASDPMRDIDREYWVFAGKMSFSF